METPKTIDEWQQQADEYLAGWKRAKADLINLQNDLARQRNEWISFATAGCLERLLPAVDALRAAGEHLPELADTIRKFDEFLKGEDLSEVPTDGRYDPTVHEVVSREKKEGAKPDTIIAVAQAGFLLRGKVLRPAKVIVAE